MRDRLQTRAADAVHGFRGYAGGKTRLDRRLPGDVHAGARLEDAAENDVLHGGRVRTRASERLADGDGPELGGREVLEHAAERPDRGPAGREDDRRWHGVVVAFSYQS